MGFLLVHGASREVSKGRGGGGVVCTAYQLMLHGNTSLVPEATTNIPSPHVWYPGTTDMYIYFFVSYRKFFEKFCTAGVS
jgi:hypothetical protein